MSVCRAELVYAGAACGNAGLRLVQASASPMPVAAARFGCHGNQKTKRRPTRLVAQLGRAASQGRTIFFSGSPRCSGVYRKHRGRCVAGLKHLAKPSRPTQPGALSSLLLWALPRLLASATVTPNQSFNGTPCGRPLNPTLGAHETSPRTCFAAGLHANGVVSSVAAYSIK